VAIAQSTIWQDIKKIQLKKRRRDAPSAALEGFAPFYSPRAGEKERSEKKKALILRSGADSIFSGADKPVYLKREKENAVAAAAKKL